MKLKNRIQRVAIFLIFIICVSPLQAVGNNCEGFTEKNMNCFQKGTAANADQVNANFAALLKKIEELEKKVGCPTGMVEAGGFCIHPETPYRRGMTWWEAIDSCNNDGFRLCSQSEVVNALKAGKLKQYEWERDGNSWYTTASQAETNPGSGGENTTCDVQGNHNEPDFPQFSVQCNHGKEYTGSVRLTVCCY